MDPRPCSPSGRPTQAGLQSPQLPLYGSNMHPSSGRNPRWFSRGLHLYHPGYRQINWSSVRCRRRQNHNQTPLWKDEHSSLAWQRLIHRSPLSHLHWMDTLRISIFLIFYSFVLYPFVCSLSTCLYFTCFELSCKRHNNDDFYYTQKLLCKRLKFTDGCFLISGSEELTMLCCSFFFDSFS